MVKIVLVLSLLVACNKKADPPAQGSAVATETEKVKPPAGDADRVDILSRHRDIATKEDLAMDPVVIHFHKFAVKKASFDPKNLEGGTATIELDPSSIDSASEERDTDLKSDAYLDIAKFAMVTVDVTNVKKQGDGTYTADAAVACHGITKTYPVKFSVLATTADSVRIKGEHAFSRLDFKIGVDPANDPTERIDPQLIIQWVLTLKR